MHSPHTHQPINNSAAKEIRDLVHPEHFSSLIEEGINIPSTHSLDREIRLAAFQYGYEAYPLYQGQRFESVEAILEQGWNASHALEGTSWKDARSAVKEGWRVLDQVLASTTCIPGMVYAQSEALAPNSPARRPGF